MNDITLNKKRLTNRISLSESLGKKIRARKMVEELNKSPMGRLLTAVAAASFCRHEETQPSKTARQTGMDRVEEKLVAAMQQVLEEIQ